MKQYRFVLKYNMGQAILQGHTMLAKSQYVATVHFDTGKPHVHILASYRQLMRTVGNIFISNPRIRLYSIRPAMSVACMMSIWSCMAFHLAGEPFCVGSDVVGMFGLCGIIGAIAASGVGKYVPRVGILRMSVIGSCCQLLAWLISWQFGNSYTGLIVAIILADIGAQCLQVANLQSQCTRHLPEEFVDGHDGMGRYRPCRPD